MHGRLGRVSCLVVEALHHGTQRSEFLSPADGHSPASDVWPALTFPSEADFLHTVPSCHLWFCLIRCASLGLSRVFNQSQLTPDDLGVGAPALPSRKQSLADNVNSYWTRVMCCVCDTLCPYPEVSREQVLRRRWGHEAHGHCSQRTSTDMGACTVTAHREPARRGRLWFRPTLCVQCAVSDPSLHRGACSVGITFYAFPPPLLAASTLTRRVLVYHVRSPSFLVLCQCLAQVMPFFATWSSMPNPLLQNRQHVWS